MKLDLTLVRRITYLPSDIFLKITGKKENLMPPQGMIFTESGDFIKQGETFLKYFIDLGRLKPDQSVLDVGSGIGRMAIPLTKYLSETGKYEGFDIVKKGIKWCSKNITANYPNFNFKYINLKNSLYNLSSNQEASQITFPYKDNCFDFVFLTSVFTHMLPSDVENYLNEINRVLKKSGICFVTFFILDKESEEFMAKNNSFNFLFKKGNYCLMDETVPEANVAYNYDYLLNTFNDIGLRIKSEHRGYWPRRPKKDSLNFQDILILEKSNKSTEPL